MCHCRRIGIKLPAALNAFLHYYIGDLHSQTDLSLAVLNKSSFLPFTLPVPALSVGVCIALVGIMLPRNVASENDLTRRRVEIDPIPSKSLPLARARLYAVGYSRLN